jgi:hypothetical protein
VLLPSIFLHIPKRQDDPMLQASDVAAVSDGLRVLAE